MERCPKCDTILKSNQKFCTKCGFKILPKKADSIKINQLISQIPILGKIHEPKVA